MADEANFVSLVLFNVSGIVVALYSSPSEGGAASAAAENADNWQRQATQLEAFDVRWDASTDEKTTTYFAI